LINQEKIMPLAFWCILVAAFMPLVLTAISKSKGIDNHNPRDFSEKMTGYCRRAHAAHQNSFEIFPLFSIAVLTAYIFHAPQSTVDYLAVFFILSRIVYAICYLADKASLRTLVWALGLVTCIAIFTASLWA
jgi:uncharacterized MAPEG superfamily protein